MQHPITHSYITEVYSMSELKIIPRVNSFEKEEGTLSVSLPITCSISIPELSVFDLCVKEPALLTFQEDKALPEEGYELSIHKSGICLSFSAPAGRIHGLTTLFELIRNYQGEIPCGCIQDAPRYGLRAYMLDVGRHFFDVTEIKRLLDQMQRLKLNTFHWHLSEDQGFRIESRKFPLLNSIGSWAVLEDGTKQGGYYTQEEIREVVAYAALRGIEVVPEIDLPGHTSAMIAAYPELSCSGEPTEVKAGRGIFNRILCPGKDSTMEFLYALLDEIVPLFPGRYFHLGGDEAPKSEWAQCPDCQARIQEEHLDGEEGLQGWMTEKLIAHLEGLGKTVIGWNEMLYSGPKLNAVGQYWAEMAPTKMKPCIEAGQRFIFSRRGTSYCDYPYTMVTLRATYQFGGETQEDIVPEDQVLGLSICSWTEDIPTPSRLEELLFPRMQALSENGWSKEKDFEDWKNRVRELEQDYLKSLGFTISDVDEVDICGRKDMDKVKDALRAFAQRGAGNRKKNEGAQELPPEVAQRMNFVMRMFIGGFFRFSFTEEEAEELLQFTMNAFRG